MNRGELHIGGLVAVYTTILRVVNEPNPPLRWKFRAEKMNQRNSTELSRLQRRAWADATPSIIPALQHRPLPASWVCCSSRLSNHQVQFPIEARRSKRDQLLVEPAWLPPDFCPAVISREVGVAGSLRRSNKGDKQPTTRLFAGASFLPGIAFSFWLTALSG
jgi:hypothetical protein